MLTSGCPSDFHHVQTTALHAHIQWSTACTHLVVHQMRHIQWSTGCGTFGGPPRAHFPMHEDVTSGGPLVGNQWTTGCEGRLCTWCCTATIFVLQDQHVKEKKSNFPQLPFLNCFTVVSVNTKLYGLCQKNVYSNFHQTCSNQTSNT